MYKVFINEKLICFSNKKQTEKGTSNCLILRFFSPDITPVLLELLENDRKLDSVLIEVEDAEKSFQEFKSSFKEILAAGGVVTHTNGKKLFIFRLGKWDLPKGKIEQEETVEEAAIREVEEECGISGLTITKRFPDTYHVYELKEKHILKRTYWFEMQTGFSGELQPQLEENITDVRWFTEDEIRDKVLHNTYQSIADLLTTFL
ncbi:MAG: NUDIX domain-containing protein [Flavobacteriales bacterium]|nr:NUDIX domain-containing protein [Flavobacteriales bacterium]